MAVTIVDLCPAPERRRETFETNGVVIVPELFSQDDIALIRKTFTDQVEADPSYSRLDNHIASDDILSRYPRFVHPHRHPEKEAGAMSRKLMVDSRVMGVVNDLIGPAWGAQSMFYFKPPTARGQAFHQDNHFLRAYPESCLATWIAVDDADAENGGLIIYPGTHKYDLMCHGESDQSKYFNTSAVSNLPPHIQPIQTSLKAGDAMFFHGHIVHGSNSNSTKDRFRRSLIFHHCPKASREIYKFYQPLIDVDGEEKFIDPAEQGGPCGEAWTEEP